MYCEQLHTRKARAEWLLSKTTLLNPANDSGCICQSALAQR